MIPADKTRRVRYIESQCVAPLTAQNRFLRLTVEPDGTVSPIDRRTGREFRRLLSYMDDGEIGDGWMHIRPAADSIVYSEGSPCRVEKLYDGPAETAFRITTELRLPKRMSYEGGGIRRSEELETVSIAATLRLGADNPYVEVETMVDNTAMDHRLKVLIPTDTEGDTYLAGQAFTLLTRPVGGLPETGTGRNRSTATGTSTASRLNGMPPAKGWRSSPKPGSTRWKPWRMRHYTLG